LVVVLHELGHFLSARLLKLEAYLVTLGEGPEMWRGKIVGVPVHMRGWPTSGMTYIGSGSLRFLRLRVWLTVLMGPATNILLLLVAIAFWEPVVRLVSVNVATLWVLFNALVALISLVPFRSRQLGRTVRSDGLQLLLVPFKSRADLETYLLAGPILSALELFKDSDYEGARGACIAGLERLPGNPVLIIALSATCINLQDFDAAVSVLQPLYDSSVSLAPESRAAILNNLALAMWLRHSNPAEGKERALQRADSLSEQAYLMYPCVLAYRSTRALLLVANNRSTEALTLLEYSNFVHGTSSERGDQQIARAFAFRQLNRIRDAEDAVTAALKLHKRRPPLLDVLGLKPAPDSV
jgi:hypothetical protein